MEGADLQAINAAACKSVGRDKIHENMEDWARSLFQSNSSSDRPEKRSVSGNVWHENGPRPHKKICYGRSSSPIYRNRTPDTQSSVSTGLAPGPLTAKTSAVHHIVSVTDALKCPFNMQNTPISPVTLFRNDVLEPITTLTRDIKSPFSLQEHDLCWFAQPITEGLQPCLFWTSWKRQIPRERRLHSLASLLTGCGWITSGRAVGVKRGVIVVDDCDGACTTSILDILNHLQKSSLSSDERAAIWVFGCRPSDIPLRSYQSL